MASDERQPILPGLRNVGEVLPAPHRLGRIKGRLVDSSVRIAADDPDEILYQHTAFCQTGLQVREWQREQGAVSLLVEAGKARHPDAGEWVQLCLPFGPKTRLIPAHLNREALIRGSPEIEVAASLSGLVKRILGFEPNGLANSRTSSGASRFP